ncbi:MAG: DMT family transporter [Halanaeroarchaeum sp.]
MSTHRNLGLFLALAVLWGTAFMAIKAGLESFGSAPVLFAAVRYDVAGAIMLAYAALTVDRWRPRGRSEWTQVIIGGVLLIAAYHAFLFVGERHTTSAVAAIIVSLSPVLTTGFARALLPSERLSATGIAGLLIGLLGVGILTDPGAGALTDPAAVGEVLILMATLSFSLGTVLTRTVEADLPTETMEAWSMVIGAGVMHLVSVALGEDPSTVALTPQAIAALAYLSLGASALGFLIYFDLLERLGPIEINLVSYVAPVFAALSGWVFLAETLTPTTVLGFLVIFAGFWLIKREALASEVDRLRRRLR